MPTLDDERIARKLWEDAKAQAVGVAKLRGPGRDQVKYTPADEQLLWNREAEGWTVEKEMQLLAEGKSREAVGLLKYPHRQQLAESGERFLDKYEQARYAAKQAQAADPTWTVTPPAGSQEPPAVAPTPEPDPYVTADPPPMLDAPAFPEGF